jgi:hypothetical protein
MDSNPNPHIVTKESLMIILEKCRQTLVDSLEGVTTSLIQSSTRSDGSAIGTGNYFEFGDKAYILTNSHVIDEAKGDMIAHESILGQFTSLRKYIHRHPRPKDIALVEVDTESNRLSIDNFDERFAPVEGEAVFWMGRPGSKAGRYEPITELTKVQTYFGELKYQTKAHFITLLSPENGTESQNWFDKGKDVQINYPNKAEHAVNVESLELPNPHGMSGSLLWDTKLVDCLRRGVEWKPENAKVCGLIWGSYEDTIIATKIEYVREVILNFLRSDLAYFHWLNRGAPDGDSLTDWYWAVDQLPEII